MKSLRRSAVRVTPGAVRRANGKRRLKELRDLVEQGAPISEADVLRVASPFAESALRYLREPSLLEARDWWLDWQRLYDAWVADEGDYPPTVARVGEAAKVGWYLDRAVARIEHDLSLCYTIRKASLADSETLLHITAASIRHLARQGEHA